MKRIFCLILAVSLLSGCGRAQVPKVTNTSKEAATPNATTAPVEDPVSVEYNYEDILAGYEELVAYRLSDPFEADWNDGKPLPENDALRKARQGSNTEWSSVVVDMTDGLDVPDKGDFGYITKDLNGDDTPELLWVRSDRTLLAIFTTVDGNPKLLDAFWPRYQGVITDAGELYTRAGGGVSITYDLQQLTPEGDLSTVHTFGIDGGSAELGPAYYEIVDNQTVNVDEAHFEILLAENPFTFGAGWMDVPITFLNP